MMLPWEWDDRRLLALALDRAGKLNLDRIAGRCGVCRRTLFKWRHAPEYVARMEEQRQAEADRMRAEYLEDIRRRFSTPPGPCPKRPMTSDFGKKSRPILSTNATPKKKAEPTRSKPKARRDWSAPFLASLRSCGVVSHACRSAKVDRTTAYVRRRRDQAFALAWAEAVEATVGSL